MNIPARPILAAAALGFAAIMSPANAIGIDPSVDYGSLKAEFAAEDAGAIYGTKLRNVRRANSAKRHGFTTKRRNFGVRRMRK